MLSGRRQSYYCFRAIEGSQGLCRLFQSNRRRRLDSKKIDSYKIVSSKIQSILSDSEFLQISRIVILDQDDPVITFLQNLKTVKNGSFEEFSGDDLSENFGFTIKKAYLLRSQKLDE